MTIILGINAFHGDAAACIVRDGVMLAAVEEERFRRLKHWAGYPSESIRNCLAAAGVSLSEVDHVALNQDPSAARWRKVAFMLAHRPDPRLVVQRLRNRSQRAGAAEHLSLAFPGVAFRGRLHAV